MNRYSQLVTGFGLAVLATCLAAALFLKGTAISSRPAETAAVVPVNLGQDEAEIIVLKVQQSVTRQHSGANLAFEGQQVYKEDACTYRVTGVVKSTVNGDVLRQHFECVIGVDGPRWVPMLSRID